MQRYLDALLPRPVATSSLLAALFFVASLTPSLVPRDTAVQAILSGICRASTILTGADNRDGRF
ncbi:MAG: hypothetical protein JJU24_16945, partial [Natronohydrobacter sp.]|nr:hypothetical protein [Natronohydrobacter sp.]